MAKKMLALIWYSFDEDGKGDNRFPTSSTSQFLCNVDALPENDYEGVVARYCMKARQATPEHTGRFLLRAPAMSIKHIYLRDMSERGRIKNIRTPYYVYRYDKRFFVCNEIQIKFLKWNEDTKAFLNEPYSYLTIKGYRAIFLAHAFSYQTDLYGSVDKCIDIYFSSSCVVTSTIPEFGCLRGDSPMWPINLHPFAGATVSAGHINRPPFAGATVSAEFGPI